MLDHHRSSRGRSFGVAALVVVNLAAIQSPARGQCGPALPGTVSDLTGEFIGGGVELRWTAPGEDGGVGTVTSYDVRHSQSPISVANFGMQQQVGSPAPLPPGSQQVLQVSELPYGRHYFALKAIDCLGNTSAMSNVFRIDDDCGSILGDPCPTADPEQSDFDSVIVGSPSGLARPYPVYLRDYEGTPIPASEIWLSPLGDFCSQPGNTTLQFYDGSGGELKCHHESCRLVDWEYQEIVSGGPAATFNPQFGGHGVINLQHELSCFPKYVGFGCIPEARSTDIDADGDTDSADKAQMLAAIQSQSPDAWFDLDVSGGLDFGDYKVILDEMAREGLTPWIQEICNGDHLTTRTVTPAPDGGAPAAVTAFTATANGTVVELRWTATGDDGTTGMASSYDVRTSTSPIDAGNFGSATPAGPVTPLPSGSQQFLAVPGLAVESCHYFAVRAVDCYGNVSPLATTTLGGSFGAVTDFTGNLVARTCVSFEWTAPGSGPFLTTASYDVRYATFNITESSFYSASSAGGPVPALPGYAQGWTVNGLASCKRYYFAVKASSCTGQVSAISNVVTVKTRCSGPVTCDPPKAAALPDPEPDDVRDAMLAAGPIPARSYAAIEYAVPAADDGRPFEIAVFDVAGRRIRSLESGAARRGAHSVDWDLRSDQGRRVAAGVFYLRLQLSSGRITRAVVVAR